MWEAGLLRIFLRDVRTTVGGGNAPQGWFANLRRRQNMEKESEIVNSGQEVSLPTQDEGEELVTTSVM